METEKLNVYEGVSLEDDIIKEEFHSYLPYGSSVYGYSDEIRIVIQNQDLMTITGDSYIYIEGKLNPIEAGKSCMLTSNAMCFLFEEIRYELGGQKVDVCKMPGITSALKGYASYSQDESRALSHMGWAPSSEIQITQALNNTFVACIPLKHILGFGEDYKKIIINTRQELILIRARDDKNCYMGETDATITLTKIQWRVPHVILSDSAKLKVFNKINRGQSIPITFRQWELFELPALKNTTTDIWPIKTSTQLEKPRFVIVAFQNNKRDNKSQNASIMDNSDITSIKLHLNSESYPYEAMRLNFTQTNYAVAYQNYVNFQRSYYGKEENPLFDYKQFGTCPIFILDCSKQNETLKTSTVDIKLELEALSAFTAQTIAYCLILHDVVFEYSPFSGEVRKL